jgi:hypothetical protein
MNKFEFKKDERGNISMSINGKCIRESIPYAPKKGVDQRALYFIFNNGNLEEDDLVLHENEKSFDTNYKYLKNLFEEPETLDLNYKASYEEAWKNIL